MVIPLCQGNTNIHFFLSLSLSLSHPQQEHKTYRHVIILLKAGKILRSRLFLSHHDQSTTTRLSLPTLQTINQLFNTQLGRDADQRCNSTTKDYDEGNDRGRGVLLRMNSMTRHQRLIDVAIIVSM